MGQHISERIEGVYDGILAMVEEALAGPPRRPACILLCAGPGDVRAARGLVGRAIRRGLGIRTWGSDPHHVHYMNTAEGEGTPRFLLDVSDDEMTAISDALRELAQAEGWSRPPVDCYHD
jgi:hypothetical protein